MSISNYFERKVATVGQDATIDQAIEVMRTYDVEDVVVVENKAGRPYPLGFLTCHDIVMKGFKKNSGNGAQAVREIMTSHPVLCEEDRGINETINLMQKFHVKRLPVVDEDGVLEGIVTASDLLGVLSEELSGLANSSSKQTWRSKRANAVQAII